MQYATKNCHQMTSFISLFIYNTKQIERIALWETIFNIPMQLTKTETNN